MSNKTFHIGISMAGAVSAGAYTAGVMDYLLEALGNWQKAKELQEQGKLTGVPKHNVSIDVLSGASAGGMTAILTSALIQSDFEHINTEDIINNSEKLSKNPLYHSWVNLTEEDGNDMMNQMLSTDDIENNPNNEIRSLFNSNFIEEIAKRHINIIKDEKAERPYFADDFEVVTTLTNLRGIPFEIEFNNPSYNRVHRMTRHFDVMHFKHSPEGKEDKGKIPFNFIKAGLNKELLKQAALATGAFPLGLEPRKIQRLGKYIIDNKYLNLSQKKILTIEENKIYTSLNIDGGTINNDPFELTLKMLDDRLGTEERKKHVSEFNSTVLMIDPFPNYNKLPVEEDKYCFSKAFKYIISDIISAMIGELRMKEDALKSAIDKDDFSRFLIIPAREDANIKKENHIACGSLGGFGGFFSKKFRQHDFILGRKNCQKFIQNYFVVPKDAENGIINFGYEGINVEEYKGVDENFSKEYFPIIPDIKINYDEGTGKYSIEKRREDIEKFVYPQINSKNLIGIEGKMSKRIKLIIKNIEKGEKLKEKKNNDIIKKIRKPKDVNFIRKWLKEQLINVGIKKGGKILSNAFVNLIIEDMYDNCLLEDENVAKIKDGNTVRNECSPEDNRTCAN